MSQVIKYDLHRVLYATFPLVEYEETDTSPEECTFCSCCSFCHESCGCVDAAGALTSLFRLLNRETSMTAEVDNYLNFKTKDIESDLDESSGESESPSEGGETSDSSSVDFQNLQL